MRITPHDRSVLRSLAAEVAAIAALPEHAAKAELWRRLNDLDSVRPMVHIYQVPWEEMDVDGELSCRCEAEDCRRVEAELRRRIYQWKHLPGDMLVEPTFALQPVLHGDDYGMAVRRETVRSAADSELMSSQYIPQITCEADVEKIRMPSITHDARATARRAEALSEALAGLLRVDVRLPFGRYNIAPWDRVVPWTGVQEILTDLAARPAYVHRLMDRLTRAHEAKLDQYESLGLLGPNRTERIGQGGYAHTNDLPGEGFDPSRARWRDLWGGGMAQVFSEVSPAMHEEFALQYERRCLKRFGLVYYGCCEPLHHKVDIIRKWLPRVRKISMSPMADLERGARALGAEIVCSAKPNPAFLAEDRWRPEAVREELRGTCRIARAHGCHVELILKDISTVRREPRRLWEWARIALEVAEEFAL